MNEVIASIRKRVERRKELAEQSYVRLKAAQDPKEFLSIVENYTRLLNGQLDPNS